MISAIVAVDNNWGIGYKGELLEHIPADLKRFKELTTGHVVVMGRKTWDSLPKKPLPNRINYVITKEAKPSNEEVAYFDMNCIKMMIQKQSDYEYFIIGGGIIYKELLPLCDRVYVTKIYKDHENVDTYFPNLDNMDNWIPKACNSIQTYQDLTYQYWEYDKI